MKRFTFVMYDLCTDLVLGPVQVGGRCFPQQLSKSTNGKTNSKIVSNGSKEASGALQMCSGSTMMGSDANLPVPQGARLRFPCCRCTSTEME